jgi:hypothetical protein
LLLCFRKVLRPLNHSCVRYLNHSCARYLKHICVRLIETQLSKVFESQLCKVFETQLCKVSETQLCKVFETQLCKVFDTQLCLQKPSFGASSDAMKSLRMASTINAVRAPIHGLDANNYQLLYRHTHTKHPHSIHLPDLQHHN